MKIVGSSGLVRGHLEAVLYSVLSLFNTRQAFSWAFTSPPNPIPADMDYVDPQVFGRPPPNPNISLPGPGRPEDTTKRRLLLIYIHGFQGSETSFQEFPKHVHGLVTDLLAVSHLVYTRIYPRYKSQGELQTAVNQFSAW